MIRAHGCPNMLQVIQNVRFPMAATLYLLNAKCVIMVRSTCHSDHSSDSYYVL